MMKILIVDSPEVAAKLSSLLASDWCLFSIRKAALEIFDMFTSAVNGHSHASLDSIEVSSADLVSVLMDLSQKINEVLIEDVNDESRKTLTYRIFCALKVGGCRFRIFSCKLTSPGWVDLPVVFMKDALRITSLNAKSAMTADSDSQFLSSLNITPRNAEVLKLVVDREGYLERKGVYQDAFKLKLGNKRVVELNRDLSINGLDLMNDPIRLEKALFSISDVKVLSSVTGRVKINPPALFTTATLVQAAYEHLGYLPSQTFMIAEELLRQGRITDYKTNSPDLSGQGRHMYKKYLDCEGLPRSKDDQRWQGCLLSHAFDNEGIRPTDPGYDPDIENESDRLYRLIYERALACVMIEGWNLKTIYTVVGETEEAVPLYFVGEMTRIETMGWRQVCSIEPTNREISESRLVPERQQIIAVEDWAVSRVASKNFQRYNFSSLIDELKIENIGEVIDRCLFIEEATLSGFLNMTKAKEILPTPTAQSFVKTRNLFTRVDFGSGRGSKNYTMFN
ncbi:DNA topoisomerase [Reinekea sp. G2M2-21]|uniref:DNA topoisomerase n=1 Tax=Reinekea sp. G2M2-21 TaxID=2788942 RepID=UPI0018AC4C2A|nr:DNA topoisomerase [Reinekea sp. G2M2-21]